MYVFAGVLLVLLGPSLSAGCGNKPFQARVVNGENASPHAWPWQISLRVNGRHICGGSLIDKDWVVTAAHCVDRNPRPSGYTVVVGAHRRTGSTSVQQTFRLRQLFKHEGFSMRNLKNDIALLQLSGSISASNQVNTVCLPSKGSQAQAGAQCYITGWGRTVGGGNAADTLQQAMLPVASHSDCSRVNGRLVPVDQRSMICAGGQGKGGCQGDSGGPFVCNEGGRYVLRGAVSWGHSMCRTDHYTVFARVSSFIDWINQKKNSGCVDKMQQCPNYKRYCQYQQIKQYCPKTCGVCGGGGGGGGGSCVDKNPSCPGWTSYCGWHKYVRANCQKTCQLC